MPADLDAIMRLEVPLIVQIASRSMPVREVMDLAPGSIIELPKPANNELEILVSNKQIGMGRAVKIAENFGVRVTYIGDLRERIEAMAAETPKPEDEPGDDDLDALAEQFMAAQ